MKRRTLVGSLITAPLAVAAASLAPRTAAQGAETLFSISLAQWSLHRTFFGAGLNAGFAQALLDDPDSVLQGTHQPLDFPRLAREEFGIDAVEYVNTFFFGHASDESWLNELKRRAEGEGVRSLLIMCDALGAIGASDTTERTAVVERHRPWLDAAALLGCHSIRVNAAGAGTPAEHQRAAADGLRQLGELAAPLGLNVLVENHGGLSSNGAWLAETIALTDHPRVGTLPDFGNFQISPRGTQDPEVYDRYRGTRELMPFARSVSAKSYDFDSDGLETTIDYERMLRIVLDAGYRGWIGVEYEGQRLPEFEGIRATKRLLETLRTRLSSEYPE